MIFFFCTDRSITSSPLRQASTSLQRFLMSEELLAAQLAIVVLANHHTPQLLRLLTVASPSEDDKSYGGMRHHQTFSDLCLHRKKKKRNDQSLSQHLDRRCRDGRLSRILQKQAAKISKSTPLWGIFGKSCSG